MSNKMVSELSGWAKSRPIRIAFFVEKGKFSDLVLDGIFADCYSRWGGRFSLIVPCRDGQIISEYWDWLETFDPDVIYSYVRLDPRAVLEIHERIVPANYIQHHLDEKPRLDVFGFKPRYNFSSLSSLSTIFRLGRHTASPQFGKIKIIDSWHTENPSRFLTDNLGTYQMSAATGIYPNDARSVAGLLTIVSDEAFNNRRYVVPKDLDRVSLEENAFNEFAAKRATCVSLLSALYAPRLEVRDYRWSSAFNLVIGDAFEDRLMFWNARLLIPAWLDDDLCCLRITLNQFDDEDFASQLVQLINARNHVNGGSGGPPRLQIRSASHNIAELTVVLNKITQKKPWSTVAAPEVVANGNVLPREESLKYAKEEEKFKDGSLGRNEWHSFRWKPPIARPPVIEPEHLTDAPPRQTFTTGLYALDLTLEDESDILLYAERSEWKLPKRWRLAGAFEIEFKTRGFGQSLPPLYRTNKHGNLTSFAGIDRSIVSVTVPSLKHAMRHALCQSATLSREHPDDPPWPKQKAQWMRHSSEAPHLIGTLGLTGNLARAERFLLHPFLREIFAILGGAPNLADVDVRATADALAKRSRGRPIFDLRQADERGALAALVVKAAQSVKAPKMYISLDVLTQRWEKYRKNFWERNRDQITGSEEELNDSENVEKKAMEDCLAEMRTRRILFQGYPWTCDACQHRNWADFQTLKISLSCDVCLSEAPLPVGIPWHFRPNEFLIESLRSHSVLSLLWVLSALHSRARTSFMYLEPTCFGFSRESEKPEAEADLLAIIDGCATLCEIKSAWRSLRSVHIEDFVNLAKRLRPDRAILAVMEDGNRFEDELRNAETSLKSEGIDFELLTPRDYSTQDDPLLLR
jgi:hypothetical protein